MRFNPTPLVNQFAQRQITAIQEEDEDQVEAFNRSGAMTTIQEDEEEESFVPFPQNATEVASYGFKRFLSSHYDLEHYQFVQTWESFLRSPFVERFKDDAIANKKGLKSVEDRIPSAMWKVLTDSPGAYNLTILSSTIVFMNAVPGYAINTYFLEKLGSSLPALTLYSHTLKVFSDFSEVISQTNLILFPTSELMQVVKAKAVDWSTPSKSPSFTPELQSLLRDMLKQHAILSPKDVNIANSKTIARLTLALQNVSFKQAS